MALVLGSPVAGSLVGGGALVVTGSLDGGGLVTSGGVLVTSGGGELVVGSVLGGELGGTGSELDGLLDFGGDSELGAVLDEGGEDDVPGLLLDEDGGVDEDEEGEDDEGDEDGGVVVVDPGGLEDGGTGVVVVPPPEAGVPPATLSITYCPNCSSVPAGGSVAVTLAPSGGSPCPSKPAASPASASCRLAFPNVAPARFGTARRLRVSKAESSLPVVPTGRLMPRSGSWTSTRAIRPSVRVAGLTATTEERSYPVHFLLPSSNSTEIRLVSPSKGRSGFPHEHFTAGSP